ncbi:MAG: hypothetical protein FVQ79_00040 [Planctomycetes bacterium]|nr:hypothetical protein [Planctomycetota bacterium]
MYEVTLAPTKDTLELSRAVQTELAKVGEVLSTYTEIPIPQMHVEPAKPREGMLRYSDGADWNPVGTGVPTFVAYTGGAWRNLQFGSSGGVTSVFGRTGDVVALQADYDSFFLTQAEADALYEPIDVTILRQADVKNSIEFDVADLQLVGDLSAPGNNQVYGTDGAGVKGWKSDVTNLVTSVFGRTGAVVALQADYDGFFLTPTEGDAAYAALGHGHTLADISDSGALAALNTVGTAEIDDDAVTYAKIQNVVAANRILGNVGIAGSIVAELTDAQVRTIINVEDGAAADQTAGEIEAIVSHDNLQGVSVNEHLDWTIDLGATNLHANNSANGVLALTAAEVTQLANIGTTVISAADWVAVAALIGVNTGDQTSIVGITGTKAQFDTAVTDGNIAYDGGAHHDAFSDFVAAEHIDWSVTGAEDIHVDRLSLADRLSFGSVLNVEASSAGIRKFYDLNDFTAPLTDVSNYTNILDFRDISGDIMGAFRFGTAGLLDIENAIRGGNFQLKLRSDLGGVRTMMLVDPEGAVDLRFTGASVAKTLAAASGGLEANNALTGAGFERVLTTSDISAAPVDSVFGRTGAVIATIGDYAAIAEIYTVLETFQGGLTVDNAGTTDFKVKQGTVEYDTRIVGGQLQFTSVNGSGWRFSGEDVRIITDAAIRLEIWNSTIDDNMAFRHDGTDAFIEFFQTADLQLGTGLTGAVKALAPIDTLASVAGGAGFNIPTGVAPTSPAQGDIWVVAADILARINGIDESLLSGVSKINTQNAAYTLVLGDRGKTIRKATSTASITHTIPANSVVAFRVGAMIGWHNDGTVDMIIAINTDILTGTDAVTGSRTLGPSDTAVIQKVAATEWKYAASDL